MEALQQLYPYWKIFFIYGVLVFSFHLCFINSAIIPKSIHFMVWLSLAFFVNFLKIEYLFLMVLFSIILFIIINRVLKPRNMEILEPGVYITGVSQFPPMASSDFIIIPRNFLELLDEKELDMVIKHEKAHIIKKHVTKKLILSSILLIANLFLQFFCSWRYFILPFFTLFLIMVLLSVVSKRFELEADLYAADSIPIYESMLKKVEGVISRPEKEVIPELLYGYIPVEERVKRLKSSIRQPE